MSAAMTALKADIAAAQFELDHNATFDLLPVEKTKLTAKLADMLTQANAIVEA